MNQNLYKAPQGIPLFTELSLKVTGCKVDTDCHSIIIAVSKTGSDIFPQSVDTDYQFRFIMYLVGKVGDENGLPSFRIAESGFIKITGSVFTCVCPSSLLCWA